MGKKVRIPIKIKTTISTPYYTCTCGRRVILVTNPSVCPYCHRITRIRR